MNQPIVGCPVIARDGRLLCYSCYQDDDTAELDCWLSDDVENYPCRCEACGQVLIHESQQGSHPA